MNGEKIHDALSLVDDALLEPVALLRERGRPVFPWIRYASLAACVCILAGGILLWSRTYGSFTGRTETAAAAETMAGVTTEMTPEAVFEEGAAETEAVPEAENYGGEAFVYTPQVSVRWCETIGDCMENADYVLICTVQEVGEAYAEEDPSIIGIPGGSGEHEYVRSIRTPLTLSVEEVLYDPAGTAGDTIQVTEFCGTVGNYTLEGIFPVQYEEGHTYLLYLAQSPDGSTYGIMGQGSAELFPDEVTEEEQTAYSHFRPLVNEQIYRDCPDVESVIEAVRTAGEEMHRKQTEAPGAPLYSDTILQEMLPEQVQYVRTSSYTDGAQYPMVYILRSPEELAEYAETHREQYDLSPRETVYADSSIGFADATGSYDADWFAGHDLVMAVLEEGSGSIRHEVGTLTETEDGWHIDIITIEPELCTDDMAHWHILIEVEKDLVAPGQTIVVE